MVIYPKQFWRGLLAWSNYRQRLQWAHIHRKYPHVIFGANSVAVGDCNFESGVLIQAGTVVRDVEVGRYTYFATNCNIRSCRIGSFCSIGPGVRIVLGQHPTEHCVSTYPSFFSRSNSVCIDFGIDTPFKLHQPVTIGHDVWIGADAIVMDGVAIGDGAIIGAGAIVTRDVPPFCIAVGNPARVIRKRFQEDQIEFLQNLKWWSKDIEWLRTHAPLFKDIRSLRESVRDELFK